MWKVYNYTLYTCKSVTELQYEADKTVPQDAPQPCRDASITGWRYHILPYIMEGSVYKIQLHYITYFISIPQGVFQ